MPERLTDRAIAAMRPRDGQYHFDSEVPGLGVRVYPSGRKALFFDWRDNGRQRRVQIGTHPAWTIGKAREHATRMRRKVDVGESVGAQRGSRVADLAEQWRAVVDLTRRPSTARSYGRLLDSHIVPRFGKGEPKAITRNAIELWHGEIAQRTPFEANRALAVLSAFLSWLEHDRLIDRNPARGVKRRPETSREIFLDAAEIGAALAALDADSGRAGALALKLALLTGCRIGEATHLTAGQISAKRSVWIKPAATTKQKRLHIAPLSKDALAAARELLTIGPPTYDQVRAVWDRVRSAIGRPDIRIHDLRHSRASALARNGASLLQIGKVLGHTSPQTTARYSHLVDRDLADLVERS